MKTRNTRVIYSVAGNEATRSAAWDASSDKR